MINSGLPEKHVLQTFNHVMGVWDSNDGEVNENSGLWEDFSNSDEEWVKGMTISGPIYDATNKEKGIIEEKRKEDEEVEDIVLRQLKKIPTQISIWELLCSSQEYRRAMVEALSKIIIPVNAEPTRIIESVQK